MNKMNVLVITGSPHKKGTSALLADRFIEGAKDAGHEVYRFDAAFKNVKPCLGCDHCKKTKQCVYQDDMEELKDELAKADLIAFVTPLYYFGMSAQIKTVIDRFYNHNEKVANKKSVLMATAYDTKEEMLPLVNHYQAIVRYLSLKDQGMILAEGCGVREHIENSDFLNQAYELGKSL